MTEFTKTKITFALALLGTLFALHPILDRYGDEGFTLPYVDEPLTVVKVYILLAGLLAFSVYSYGLALLTEQPGSWTERLANYAYALALLIVPLYGILWVGHELAQRLGVAHLTWATPATLGVLGVSWLGLAWGLRRRLSAQDRSAQIEQLAQNEIAALNRAREMFASDHFDLSVIEAWKAIEARLRRVLLRRGRTADLDNPQAMIDAARRAGLLREPAVGLLQELRHQWNVAVGVEPLTREAADSALSAARHILATIPVAELDAGHAPTRDRRDQKPRL